VPKILQWIRDANRERERDHRPLYSIMDAAQFLEGARERLPLALAAEAALAPRGRRADAGLVIEPTTGPVAEGPVDASVATPVPVPAPVPVPVRVPMDASAAP